MSICIRTKIYLRSPFRSPTRGNPIPYRSTYFLSITTTNHHHHLSPHPSSSFSLLDPNRTTTILNLIHSSIPSYHPHHQTTIPSSIRTKSHWKRIQKQNKSPAPSQLHLKLNPKPHLHLELNPIPLAVPKSIQSERS